jgi:phosphocarrier protein
VEVRRTVTIVNDQGLHARPCHTIVSAAQDYRSELRIRSGGREVNGKSILELMTLGAAHGTELEICARGQDAEGLVEAITQLFAAGFGEED